MADGVTVTVRGKDKLFAKLKRMAPEADKALTKVNGDAAEEMAALARNFAPVRTGKLRDSITVTPPGGTPPAHSQGAGTAVPEGAFMVTAGNTKVRYARLVEFGTQPHVNAGEFAGTQNPGAKAQPFFFSALRLIRKKQKSRATRAINKAIKAVIGS